MPRIAGKEIPANKKIWVSLTYIRGIGETTAKKICRECGIDEQLRAHQLNEEELRRINAYIERNLAVEGELRKRVSQDIQRLISISCYRGIRHIKGLPARGQRTQSNARTRKGPRRTVAGKRKAPAPK
jgi:small subunit ribosomal protein S13